MQKSHLRQFVIFIFSFINADFQKTTNLLEPVLGHEGSRPVPMEQRLGTPVKFQVGQLYNCHIVQQRNVFVEFDDSEILPSICHCCSISYMFPRIVVCELHNVSTSSTVKISWNIWSAVVNCRQSSLVLTFS